MDLENLEAHDSARITENIHPVDNAAQTALQEETQSEAPPLADAASLQEEITEAAPSPHLFRALEALLGGIDAPEDESLAQIAEPASTSEAAPPKRNAKHDEATPTAIDTPMEDAPVDTLQSPENTITTKHVEVTNFVEAIPAAIISSPEQATAPSIDAMMEDLPTNTSHIAPVLAESAETVSAGHPTAAALNSLVEPVSTSTPVEVESESIVNTLMATEAVMEDTPTELYQIRQIPLIESAEVASAGEQTSAPTLAEGIAVAEPAAEEEHPEWEVDSAPIESSSDDSSSDDSSSEESDEGDNAYKLLTPEEQARILMADGGSDDEGEKPKGGSGSQPRTKNEILEKVVTKPDVIITPEMKIIELGNVETVVDSTLLIKAKTSGEYQVLESGSVLCLENRDIVGAVAETIGRVQQPFYSVLFTNMGEITTAGLAIGTKIFYSEQHSKYVFTQALKGLKGSDASNIHDEEVGDDEMEFSDDEAEAEHKRQKKLKKMNRPGGRMQQNGAGRGGHGHPLQQQLTPYDGSTGLKYDDADDDGPYKPLARPAGYAHTVGRSEAPEESGYSGERPSSSHSRDQFRGRGRGDRGRGRGDRGRGDRGRGRGGQHSQRGGNSGYSLPSQQQRSQQMSPNHNSFPPPPFQPQGSGFAPPASNFFNMATTQPYSPSQPQLPAWPQFPPQPPFMQQSFPQTFPNGQSWPNIPGLNGGAFLNPAFFTNNNQTPPTGQFNDQGRGRGRGNRGT